MLVAGRIETTSCRQTMDNLIENYKDRLPESYLKFIHENKRICTYLDDELGYVDIWDTDLLNKLFYLVCENHDSLGKDWFPIGSDGGGENICIKLTSSAKELFYIPAISTSDEDAMFYCDNFSKLYDAIKLNSEK